MIRRAFIAVGALLLSLAPPDIQAQGTLSTQGFGYPPGQISARSRAMGGALGELDPVSALNPAALGELGRPGVYFEYAPEFRHVLVPGGEDDATVIRFPLLMASLPVGERFMLGFSFSSLLDRTWETSSPIELGVAPDTATGLVGFRADGAINDLRLALSYQLHSTLRLGLGVHALTGESRTERHLEVSDSTQFTPALEKREFGFSGNGISLGLDWRPIPSLALGASVRTGGTVSALEEDSTLSTGSFPRRAGASLQYSGVRGILFAARADWEQWSRLAPLSLTGVPTFDSWEFGFGLEGRGPRVFGADLPLRIGVRHRALPFGLPDGSRVTETGLGAGIGAPVAGGRAYLDFTGERLMRRSGESPEENAWVFAFGLLVRI